MEIKHLDLCETRCPMALLLVKRAAAKLSVEQELLIYVNDLSSKQDILYYLNFHKFKIHTQEFETMTRYIVTIKKD